jgi:MFS family permease
LVPLGTAQFLIVLDTSVMNVSISQLVTDFSTTITAIQATITLYTLVMAAFLVVGSQVGDILGRRRTFGVGLVIYGIGSALTSIAPTLWVLVLGWSVIEGLGGALVLPALAALVGGNYTGPQRAAAYGVIGGLAGAGIAVGPLLGGWVTTYLTWRLVFAGEVVIVVFILLTMRWIADAPPTGPRRKLDAVGAALSVLGLTLVVLGVLQSGAWGWLRPLDPPFTVLGFSPTPFVIAAGLVVLGLLGAARHPLAAGRPGHLGGAEPHPPRPVLHDSALPAGRTRPRRVRDRSAPAPRVGDHAGDLDVRTAAQPDREPTDRGQDRLRRAVRGHDVARGDGPPRPQRRLLRGRDGDPGHRDGTARGAAG